RPVESSFSRYKDINARIAPHPIGGHNWHPMAFNPVTGLVYIPANEGSQIFATEKEFAFQDDGLSWNTGTGYNDADPVHHDSLANKWEGRLIAWDPIAQEEIWNIKQQSFWNAGVLTTEDLVFQGTGEGNFKAYDALSGKELWSFPLQTGIVAPPVTYMVDGIQYITLVAGWGGGMAIWHKYIDQVNPGGIYTFAIGSGSPAPQFTKKPARQLIELDFIASNEQLANGNKLFDRYCSKCHSGDGVIPNLSYSRPEIFEAFNQIVGEGAFLGKGMPKFGERLSEKELSDIKNYILSDAKNKVE